MQIGITIRAYDLDGEDLGEIHLPAPVLVGDVPGGQRQPPDRRRVGSSPRIGTLTWSESARADHAATARAALEREGRPLRDGPRLAGSGFPLRGQHVHAVRLEVDDPATASYGPTGRSKPGLNAKVPVTS